MRRAFCNVLWSGILNRWRIGITLFNLEGTGKDLKCSLARPGTFGEETTGV